MAGGTELTRILDLILAEKRQNIIPTNIKSGIEVLGVTGEYTGIKTYSSVSAMNNDLANIQENEIAKVVVDNVTTYYIKNTTMKELYKEGTTLSPTDYEQAQTQIANLLDEEVSPYTELEYIQSTGTQWIDTGVLPTVDTKSIIDFQFTGDNTIGTVFGVREMWDSRGYWVGADSDRLGNRYWLQIGSSSSFTNRYSDTNRHTIDFSKTGLYLDNILISTISPSSFVAYANLPLFRSVDGSSISYMCQKLYSFQVYESDTLIRDFIPVKRVSDDEICLYDKAEGEFYTNDGTGTFTAGPEID